MDLLYRGRGQRSPSNSYRANRTMVGQIGQSRDWISILETFGLATMIILFMGICLWRAAGWAGENMLKPIVARYIALIDALVVSVTKQGDAMVKIVELMGHLANKIQSPK